MIKRTKKQLESSACFYTTSVGMKTLHTFALMESGCYVQINGEFIYMDKVEYYTCISICQEDITLILSDMSKRLGYLMQDIDILQNFVKQ